MPAPIATPVAALPAGESGCPLHPAMPLMLHNWHRTQIEPVCAYLPGLPMALIPACLEERMLQLWKQDQRRILCGSAETTLHNY